MSSPSKSPTMEPVEQTHPHPKASVTQVTAYSGSPSPIKKLQPVPNEASLTGTTHDPIVADEKRQQDAFLKSFPPGYRFNPRDDELLLYYLQKKISDEPLPPNKIMEVNLYRHNPEYLADRYDTYGEKEWYFFTPRDRKYRNGLRPNRAAGDGYWKATGADKTIRSGDKEVGSRKALVFYRGKPPKGEKTNWIMHEYRVPDKPVRDHPRPPKRTDHDMRLDNWVLCRIYKKPEAKNNKSQTRNLQEDPAEESISTSLPPDNIEMEVEMNGQIDNSQALESEKAYPYTNVHPPLEYDRAYPSNAYPYPGLPPMHAMLSNNMLHHHRFQPMALSSGDSYANMGQMQQTCDTTSPMQYLDQNHVVQFAHQKHGAQFSDQRFIIQQTEVTSESMVCTHEACSHQNRGEQFSDKKPIMQSMVPQDEVCSDHKFAMQPPPASDHKFAMQPPPASDHGLRYLEETEEIIGDHDLMFGYPSLETFPWP